MPETAPSFLAETPAETAEFDSVRDAPETPVTETPEIKPAVEPEPKPPLEKPDAKPEGEKPKFVPHAALHEERTRRQEADRRIATMEAELLALRGGKQPEAETKEIDPETDPIAALKEVRQFQKEQRERGEQETNLRNFDARVQAHEKDFATATPDYGDAVAFLREARAGQIKAAYEATGRQITDQQLGQILLHEARSTSNDALTNGKNPGEVFYMLAKSFGYTGKAPAVVPPEEKPVLVPEIETKAAKSNETIDRLTKGQKVASKAPGGGEPADAGEMSLEAIGKLDGAAFDSAMAKFSAAQKKSERNLH